MIVRNEQLDTYQTVMELFLKNSYNPEDLSDTWKIAFERKGRQYAKEEMENMLAAGSRVSSMILNWNFMIDEHQLDPKDPYLRKILENGETNIGNPYKNNLIFGKYYSSGFLRNAISAAQLVKALDQKGFKSPRIVEIGGGTGQLQYILRKYYNEDVTLYSVDLPETLMLQMYYLLSHFPDVRYTHKATDKKTELVSKGFNFINAYFLNSQNFEFDAVINIASLQEMTKDTVKKYFEFIHKNISTNGIFLFKNCYGHATDSIVSPSEYLFDQYWKLEKASVAYSSEIFVHPAEFLSLIFSRTQSPQNVVNQQYGLRYVWNGLQTKHLMRKQIEGMSFNDQAKEVVKGASSEEFSVDFSSLTTDYYLKADAFYDATKIPNFKTCVIDDRPDAFVKLIAKSHAELIGALKRHLSSSRGKEDIAQIKTAISDRLYSAFETYFQTSDYECSYIAAMLIGLGSDRQAADIIKYRLGQTKSTFEKIRYFYLLKDIQQLSEHKDHVLALLMQESHDVLSRLQLLDLLLTCDSKGQFVHRVISKSEDYTKWNDYNRYLLLKILFKHQCYEETIILQCLESVKGLSTDWIRTLLFEYGDNLKTQRLLIFDKIKAILKKASSDEFGVLLYDSLEHSRPEDLFTAYLKKNEVGFFKLGYLANLLFKYKLPTLADQCLEESVRLRPNNFKHYSYVADVYFENHQYAKAQYYYQLASQITPYFIHLIYRQAYCELPLSEQDNGLFTTPDKIGAFMLGYSRSYLNFLK